MPTRRLRGRPNMGDGSVMDAIEGSRTGLVVLAVLAAAVVAALIGAAAAEADEVRRLEQTRQRISEVKAQLDAAEQQRAQDKEALAEAQRRFQEILGAVSAAEQAVQRQEQAVHQAREELASLRERAERQRSATQDRALSLYKRGAASVPAGAILEADSAGEALRRSGYVELAAKADRRIIEGLAATGTAVDAKQDELEHEQATLERVAEERRALMAEVQSLRDERAAQLAATQQQVDALEAEESHLESESRELAVLARRAQEAEAARAARAAQSDAGGSGSGDPGSDTVGAAQRAAQEATQAASSASGWTWPANGPVTSGYGWRWGRRHEGIDIGAGTGSPIYAARSGTVRFTGGRGGYGNMTLVSHGGGITTAYAHQSSIAVSPGQQVSAGQRIGSVGCTGSCTGPHLHFEVRVNGAPRNPRGYLP